jgi:hypothetical protein
MKPARLRLQNGGKGQFFYHRQTSSKLRAWHPDSAESYSAQERQVNWTVKLGPLDVGNEHHKQGVQMWPWKRVGRE